MSKVIDFDDGSSIKFELWDTAGQERYKSLMRTYYRKAKGALIVFDLTNPVSFQHVEEWAREVRECGEEGCAIMLAGNKADMENVRGVGEEEGELLAELLEVLFF